VNPKTEGKAPESMLQTSYGVNNTQLQKPVDSTFYANGDKTFYVKNNQTVYNKNFDASITNADFPEMKVRGRVIENRIDLELERNGNILQEGRDEKFIIQNKRE
jgi:hypothetical protein